MSEVWSGTHIHGPEHAPGSYPPSLPNWMQRALDDLRTTATPAAAASPSLACPRCKSGEVVLWFQTEVSYRVEMLDGSLVAHSPAVVPDSNHHPEWHCQGCDLDWPAEQGHLAGLRYG